MDNETKEKAAELAGEAKKKTAGIWAKIAGLWKSGTKGKAICIVGVLVILGIIGAFVGDGEGGGGGGGDWTYTGKDFLSVFDGFPKDEGEVYFNNGHFVRVMQATKKGNLVEYAFGSRDRVIWVETTRRYEDGEFLDEGYYIRRGSMEYETAMGAEKRVARYVEVSGSLLEKVKKQIADEKAAAEAKAKAEAEAAAKAKAEIVAMQAGKKPGETKTITLPGGVQMEMAWCPAGTFMMGSNDGDSDERPVHEVTLTKGFWMAKSEVTQAQWKSVMGNNPSVFEGDDLPVENVSWDDCQEFCEKTGLQLPTEAQWEYACRAGSTGEYAGTGNLDDMGWYDGNSGNRTHPVGQKQPNAWGLYDMHGNVWEWCADWYGDYPDGSVTDPKGASSGSGRVYRGGCWGHFADYCRSAYRGDGHPSVRDRSLGFRPARVLSE
ncbi:MAG: formylglycine-generating enzyme family protein [Kiritimatiellae bacterium]|nr:formylglycine-generating enzyme family protein [Kiritimatiellia bacterium]